MSSISIGKKVKLQGLSATKIYLGDDFVGYGYIVCGESREITIVGTIGKALIDSEGGLHNIVPEHDDDFCAIVS